MLFKGNHTGFASPADDFMENDLDLNKFLIKHPAATFFVKLETDNETILIVDRAEKPKHHDTVLAVVDGEFTLKRIDSLHTQDTSLEVWGVVMWKVEKLNKEKSK